MENFKDKIVWITGASSGIGEGLVMAFAKAGAKVVLSARRREELEKVQQNAQLNDSNSLILPLDVSHTDSLTAKTQEVLQKFGRIDILVNNAGITQRAAFKDLSFEVVRQIMEINFFGNIALTKAVLPHLLAQKSGSIVVISSVVGKFGTPLRTLYAASKHALHGFYDALRAETWTDNLHVMLVCPGYVKTNISLNAVMADGSKQNKMDSGQDKGMSPLDCAEQILSGIRHSKAEIYPAGFKELMAVYLKRFFPAVLRRMVRKVNVT
jgi:short-subunit dehydrogenase